MTSRRTFLLLLLLYLLLALAYSVVQPLGEAPDEADHYAYARYIGLNRALPEGPTVTQSKHPPLYHALAAGLTRWTGMDFDFLRSNPDAIPLGPDAPPNFFVHTTLESFPWRGGALAMHLGRFLSVLMGAITIWATWQLGRESFPTQPEIGLLAAAFLAGLPGFLYISGAMNNDNAAGAFGSLALLLMARLLRRGVAWPRAALLGLIFGLGLLSKVGTLALWPLAALAVAGNLWTEWRSSRAWAKAVGHLALVWGLGLLIASPWLLRNWRLYGDPFGWELVRATVDQRTAPLAITDLIWLARGLFGYFWGRFGPIGQIHLPSWAYPIALAFTLFIFVGIILHLRRHLTPTLRPPTSDPSTSSEPALRPLTSLLLLAFAPLLVLASIVQYSTIALGTDQARLLWPAIAAIAVSVAVGLAGWVEWLRPPQPRRWLVPAFTVVMATYSLATLLLVIRPAFAPPPPGVIPSEKLATFGPDLDLVAAELPSAPLSTGQSVPLTLFWRARQPLADDLRPVVRLIHQDDWLAAERDHSPAQGRYATDRWQPSETIADPYLLTPNPPSAGEFTIMVGVRPFRGEWLQAEPASTQPFVVVGTIIYR